MLAVGTFEIGDNSFTGMLPESSLRVMIAVTYSEVQRNRFTGLLPSGGIRAMRALEVLATYENRLAGMLPEGIFFKAMSRLYISDNFFAGRVAESLPR
eukprot:4126688-Amphidinium_carterae.1